MQIDDPMQQGKVPTGGDAHAVPGDRFTPSPLSSAETCFLKDSLRRDQLRRHLYRAGSFRVRIDGEEWAVGDLGAVTCGAFIVPLTTSYLEIFGDDTDGALLLAVFPLPEQSSFEDEPAQHLWITLEGGQTLGIDMSLGVGAFGVASEYVIRLTYSEPDEVSEPANEGPSAQGISVMPRSEDSTPRRQWISASGYLIVISMLIA